MSKLDVLNSIELVEADGDGEALFYACAEPTEELREKLAQLVEDADRYIEDHKLGELVDISEAAWNAGAQWFDDNRWYDSVPQSMGSV